MDFDLLVAEITKRVAQKMEEKVKEEQPQISPANDKPKILILTQEHGQYCHESLENCRLTEYYQTECALVKNYECSMKDYEAVILYDLTNDILGKITAGISDTPFLSLVSQAILTGKKIYVPEEAVELYQYKQSAPKVYYSMMNEKLNFLRNCNFTFCCHEDLDNEILGCHEKKAPCNITSSGSEEESRIQPISQDEALGAEAVVLAKKVITERDIRNAYESGADKIIVSKRAIITDLALEYARYRKISLEKSK